MVKINGNRVEPGEIEGVANKVLKVDWSAARIFDDGKRVFIALYYTANIEIDEERVRREMEMYLPYYMIPAFFIHIDQVPLRPNGKMDRKALPKPNFEDYKEDYVEPRDDIGLTLFASFWATPPLHHPVSLIERLSIPSFFIDLIIAEVPKSTILPILSPFWLLKNRPKYLEVLRF